MSSGKASELLNTLLCEDGNERFSLRVIEHRGSDGTVCRKFGIIQLSYCDKSGRWTVTGRHQVLLELASWSKLLAHRQTMAMFVEHSNERGRSITDSGVVNTESASNCSAAIAGCSDTKLGADVYRDQLHTKHTNETVNSSSLA